MQPASMEWGRPKGQAAQDTSQTPIPGLGQPGKYSVRSTRGTMVPARRTWSGLWSLAHFQLRARLGRFPSLSPLSSLSDPWPLVHQHQDTSAHSGPQSLELSEPRPSGHPANAHWREEGCCLPYRRNPTVLEGTELQASHRDVLRLSSQVIPTADSGLRQEGRAQEICETPAATQASNPGTCSAT